MYIFSYTDDIRQGKTAKEEGSVLLEYCTVFVSSDGKERCLSLKCISCDRSFTSR